MKSFDLAIIGGGIAGLWTLAAAKEKGIKAVLFEKDKLGCGQSLASQGIIHGGSKYSLTGSLSNASKVISSMPSRWLNSKQQQNDVNLSEARILSLHQYLIPAKGADSKLLSFLGSKTMASFSKKITIEHAPQAYQDLGVAGSIFELHEPVFAVDSIFEALQKQYQSSIYQHEINAQDIKKQDQGFSISLGNEKILTHKVLLTCGEGFQEFSSLSNVKMQKRALHMVMVKSQNLPEVFAHFIGRSSKPLLTITSHKHHDDIVWYLGGNLAETGTTLSSEQQIKKAKELLLELIPNLKNETLEFDSFSINRAEPKQSGLMRPDDAFVETKGSLIIGWPTKLALAPRFADKVLQHVENIVEQDFSLDLPLAKVANYRWHKL